MDLSTLDWGSVPDYLAVFGIIGGIILGLRTWAKDRREQRESGPRSNTTCVISRGNWNLRISTASDGDDYPRVCRYSCNNRCGANRRGLGSLFRASSGKRAASDSGIKAEFPPVAIRASPTEKNRVLCGFTESPLSALGSRRHQTRKSGDLFEVSAGFHPSVERPGPSARPQRTSRTMLVVTGLDGPGRTAITGPTS